MDEGNDWVADVRRWYFGRDRSATATTAAPQHDAGDSAFAAVGYESACPALQTDWPGAAPETQ
jgi:hypothetical protein